MKTIKTLSLVLCAVLLVSLTAASEEQKNEVEPELFPEFANIEEGIQKAQESVQFSDWCSCKTARVPLSTLRSALWYRSNYYTQKEKANRFESLFEEAQANSEERLKIIEKKNTQLGKAQTTQSILGYTTAIATGLAVVGWVGFLISQ